MAILSNSNAISSSGGYNINNSLRFRQSVTANLSRTPATSGNLKTMTFSVWVKGMRIASVYQDIFSSNNSSGTGEGIGFRQNNIQVWIAGNASGGNNWQTDQVFRDPSAWYHIVVAIDTTQATASDRILVYINGVVVTSIKYANYPAQNANAVYLNKNTLQQIGTGYTSNGGSFDGYMTEINFIDGQQLTASSFGEFDSITGVWKPKKYIGTYGTNGYYLTFSDIATTSGSNAGLGKDFSGNANYWNTNNISVTSGTTYDAMTDSPTLTSATVANYATLNPLNKNSSLSPTDGNLSINIGVNSTSIFGTIGMSSGKWYWEVNIGTISSTAVAFGIATENAGTGNPFQISTTYGYGANATKWNAGASSAYGTTYTNGDVIGVAFDADAGTLTFYKNNTSQGIAFSSISSNTYFPYFGGLATSASNIYPNFGQRPFAYTPPTGYVALNTYNLPDSTIKKGNSYMDATIWTGDGSTNRTITNAASFKPDFVWLKERDISIDNILYDSIRGPSTSSASKALSSNQTIAEGSENDNSTYGYLDSFTSSGFTVVRGSNGTTSYTNKNNGTYVGWQWQAGQGTTSSNTSGSITSTVSVNASAGFSIVTYTGNGTAGATIGHGLGVKPSMIIVKNRSGVYAWPVFHTSIDAATGGNGAYLTLSSTVAKTDTTTGDAETVFGNGTQWVTPTSTVFTIGGWAGVNTNTSNYVAYCWADISGYSKAFSYTGNGSTDGSFIFLGFTPRFVLIKRTDTTGDWYMWDTARNTYDVMTNTLLANSSAAETSATSIDALSNGFKLRNTTAGFNASVGTYVGMAWASNPFKNSNAF